MSDALLERSKIYLLHADKNDISIYDHLSELILQLVTTKPPDALEKFEEFSKSLKSSLFIQQPFKQVALDEKKAPNVLDFLISNSINKGRELIKNQLKETKVKIPNMIEESFYFSRLGIGLGQEETSQIYFHFKNFFSDLPLRNARFFGKIYGLENNYYIVEAEPLTPTSLPPYIDDYVPPSASNPVEQSEAPAPLGEADPDEPKTPPPKPIKPVENPPPEAAEERTPNQYIYYVSFGPALPWVRLPDVTPDLIRASRSFQKMFTGNLNALISNGYPEFPGVEKHLLRAQLARIVHATTVLPRTFVPEGAGEEEEQDGAAHGYISIAEGNYPQNVNVNTLSEENQWIHSRPPILVQGRVRKWPLPKAEGEGEEEKEDPNAPEEVVEPGEEGLGVDLKAVKGIEEDAKITAGSRHVVIPSFSFRRDNVVPDSPLLLKSNFWPGSYTMAYGGAHARLASVYIGYGTKYTALPYTAPPPPELPEEYPDLDEKIDPTVDQEDRARAAQEESAIDAAKGEEEEGGEEEDDEV